LLQPSGSGLEKRKVPVPKNIDTMSVEELREWARGSPMYVQRIQFILPSIHVKSSPNYECSCTYHRHMGNYVIQCIAGHSVGSCLDLEASEGRGMVVTGMQFSTRLKSTPENPVSEVVGSCEYPVRPAENDGSRVNAGRRGRCCILRLTKVGEHS
jgi:hypothetical protein